MTGQFRTDRPVFQNSNGIYLFYFAGKTWVVQPGLPSDVWNAQEYSDVDAWNPANPGWNGDITVEWVGDDPSAEWKAIWYTQFLSELLDDWMAGVTSVDFIPQRVVGCDEDALSPVAEAQAAALPTGETQIEPSVIFSDETFTLFYHPETVEGSGMVETPEIYGELLLEGEAGRHQLYDDGTHGDAIADDGVYSRSCLSLNEESLGGNLFTDFFGTIVLSTSLRGTVDHTQVNQHVRTTDSGYFINIGDEYADRRSDLWNLISPETCLSCAVAWDISGDVFDFFIIQDRDSTAGGGYIRVHDNIVNTGFKPPCEPRSHCYEIVDGREHREFIGILDNHYIVSEGFTHELGHGLLGMEADDFPAAGNRAWNAGDGQHLDSDTTVTGELSGPFWDPARGWPYPVLTPNGEEVYLTVDDSGEFRIKPIDDQRYVWADIFLYMMGLLPPEDVTETYYKLVNPHIDGCESNENGLICSETLVTAEEVIPFTIDDFIAQFGVREPAYNESQKSWNVGILFISDRQHTEAEMTWLTLSFKEYATATSRDNLIFIKDTPWKFATRGLSSLVIDPAQMTLRELSEDPTDLMFRGAPIEGFPGWRTSSWYKNYNVDSWPWIYHDEHGWQFVSENSNSDGIFLFDFGLINWIFLNQNTYRWMYLYGANPGWVWTFEDNNPYSRFFQRFDDGSLFSVPPDLSAN